MEAGAARRTGLSMDYLEDFLMEFDQVVQEFDKGEHSQYEQHLEELKSRTLPGTSSEELKKPPPPRVYDSGIDDSASEGNSPSLGSSLNTSQEDLGSSAHPAAPYSQAKLGDTHELEEFIADLDRALEEM
ncbi:regulator of cell cycle RGCC-like isoform X1 [Varanus komodoensis]|uniref:regulator of cell cycle RGCC-like isoform X1 n=1 Tax=Varanus komodoensis TaxID=61221 RepID=UPI001CF78C7B|nr:regulator of cell cycle RGCC-like isoform X1 [Varanus komodoensis]